MEDEYIPLTHDLNAWFENTFSRVLSGEKIDFWSKDLTLYRHLSKVFEILSAHLMADIPARKHAWYDGLNVLSARPRKARQIEFEGEMWVGDGGDTRNQWTEPFRLRVTDKRVTKQGLWLTLWLGEDRSEAQWSDIFVPTN